MEDVIKKALCNFCMNNKRQGWMEYTETKVNNVRIYKCASYIYNNSSTPYTELDYKIRSKCK